MSSRSVHPEIGVCGLSCRLCPLYHAEGESRCGGCKSESRMAVGCSLITCAVKRKGIEFCWDCRESGVCEKWKKHREFGREHDSFVCYQRLEDNISRISRSGVDEFEEEQKIREGLLREMLLEFNEGRSRTHFCIAATVLEVEELRSTLNEARKRSEGLETKEKSKVLRAILGEVAGKRSYSLKLRK